MLYAILLYAYTFFSGCQWLSSRISTFITNKTDRQRHDTAEMLLSLALTNQTQTKVLSIRKRTFATLHKGQTESKLICMALLYKGIIRSFKLRSRKSEDRQYNGT